MERVKNNFYDVENNKTPFHLASLDTITLFTEKIDCSVSSTPLHQRKCIRRVHSRQTHSYLLLRPRAMNRIELEAVSYVGSLVFEKRNRSLDRACTSRPCECQTFQSRPDRMKYRFRLMYLYTIRKKNENYRYELPRNRNTLGRTARNLSGYRQRHFGGRSSFRIRIVKFQLV